MKKTKKYGLLFILAFLLTLSSAEYAQAKTPAKLKAKDFIYTAFGKKTDFFKLSKNDESYYQFYVATTDTKNVKSRGNNNKSFKTYRKVGFNSTEALVKKQYGKAVKRKVTPKEKFYKWTKYELCGYDFSACKSYLEYTYKKGGNKYHIRFYLNKKNKVAAVVYFKNPNKFYNYPNKEVNPGLSFKTPKGKKVTTKKINGKKVYMIPKGTKISFKNFKKLSSGYFYDYSFSLYNLYGERIAREYGDSLSSYEDYSLETLVSKRVQYSNMKNVNTKKLGKYLYFTLRCEDYQ